MRKSIAMASVDFPAKIWVDAICITQGDIAERNKQVTRMRDIYTQAQIVWLLSVLRRSTIRKDSIS
jgi:hypothetical protein